MLKNILLAVVVFTVVFYGHRFVQGYFGEQALEALPFEQHSLEQGQQIAQTNGKYILADLSAIWCPSCRKLDEEVFSSPIVADTIMQEFVYVRMEYDSEEGKAFAKKFDLQGFPRVLVLTPQGERISELPLVFNATAYNANLQKVLTALKQGPVAQ